MRKTNKKIVFFCQHGHLYTPKKRIFALNLLKLNSCKSDEIWPKYGQKTDLRTSKSNPGSPGKLALGLEIMCNKPIIAYNCHNGSCEPPKKIDGHRA